MPVHRPSEECRMTVTSQPGFTIVDFVPDDFDAVFHAWQESGLWMRPSDGREHVLLKLERDPDLFLVARDAAGAVIGSAMGGWDGRRAYVYHLGVVPAWQRRGVATALMDVLEERFRARGAVKCKCQILGGNDVSTAFFAARGYELETPCMPYGKELVPGGAPRDDCPC
jgi:ribosomal protein S18 acetylase RimI-like enzyme